MQLCIVVKILLPADSALCCARQFNLRAACKPELFGPIRKFVYAETVCNFAEIVVAGILQRFDYRLVIVPLRIFRPALDRVLHDRFARFRILNIIGRFIVDCFIDSDNTLHQPRKPGAHFED